MRSRDKFLRAPHSNREFQLDRCFPTHLGSYSIYVWRFAETLCDCYNCAGPTPSRLPEILGLPTNFVLYAGPFLAEKGQLVLAQALRELMTSRSDLHLVYAGGIYRKGGAPFPKKFFKCLAPAWLNVFTF